ncbi:regulator of volume decrease after cellular swelling-domain-containing protein [Gongronella butleri]|nr:regulator of volume decrease after cellular swelling-domain-containing protein [Gongronella butleri]
MTITLLSQAPDFSDLTVRYTGDAALGGGMDVIQGALYVCESMLYFYSEAVHSGIAVEYPDVIIHAISRQDTRPSIYCQLDAGLFFPSQQLPADEDQDDLVTELFFMPDDPETLEDIYLALSECAALHPDLDMADEDNDAYEDGDDSNYFVDPSDPGELNEVQQAALRHLESVFEQPAPPSQQHHQNGHEHQFDDAVDEQ